MTGDALQIRRWRSGDVDKLLVTRGATPVAWLDPADGSVLTAVPEVSPQVLRMAYDQWRQGWHDLATHAPGQLARQRADEQRDAMGQYSRWIAWAVDAKTDERAWRLGAHGERIVGGRLEKLRRRGFEVLHSVTVGTRGSDIDHLLVGPPGVFTINTKHHPRANIWVRHDAVKVNGHNVPYVRNSRFEAQRVQRALAERLGWSPPVAGVVVVIAERLTVKEPPQDAVAVIGSRQVPGWFRRRRGFLAAEQVQEVYAVARRSTTWG